MPNRSRYSSYQSGTIIQSIESKIHETPRESKHPKSHHHCRRSPRYLRESSITQAEILCITETKYTKRYKNIGDLYTINKHLADSMLPTLGKDDQEPIASENLEIHAPNKLHHPIRALLHKHEDIWSGKLGNISATTHRIDLVPGTRPFKSAPYCARQNFREFEGFEIKRQLAAYVIDSSNAEWAALVLFAPKKDGRLRFCVDYRKLNRMTTEDSYPLTRIEECIDSLGDASIFSMLDSINGYWQIDIAKQTVTRHPSYVISEHSNTSACN